MLLIMDTGGSKPRVLLRAGYVRTAILAPPIIKVQALTSGMSDAEFLALIPKRFKPKPRGDK